MKRSPVIVSCDHCDFLTSSVRHSSFNILFPALFPLLWLSIPALVWILFFVPMSNWWVPSHPISLLWHLGEAPPSHRSEKNVKDIFSYFIYPFYFLFFVVYTEVKTVHSSTVNEMFRQMSLTLSQQMLTQEFRHVFFLLHWNTTRGHSALNLF